MGLSLGTNARVRQGGNLLSFPCLVHSLLSNTVVLTFAQEPREQEGSCKR